MKKWNVTDIGWIGSETRVGWEGVTKVVKFF